MISIHELMVGDYITLADSLKDGGAPLIFKVVALNSPGDGDALVLLNGEKACDEVAIDNEWSGIPIMPAILEKNDWFYKNGYWTKKGPVRLSWKEDGTLIVGYFQFPCAVESVHTLQNILRILGLEDITL